MGSSEICVGWGGVAGGGFLQGYDRMQQRIALALALAKALALALAFSRAFVDSLSLSRIEGRID